MTSRFLSSSMLASALVLLLSVGVTSANGPVWSLPYVGSTSTPSNAFELTNTGIGRAASLYCSDPASTSPTLFTYNAGAGAGVYSTSLTGSALYGSSSSGDGVFGFSSERSGVAGFSGAGAGVYGSSDTWYGVVGSSNSGLAGYFNGNVQVAGTLSKAAGSFKIDHPLYPSDKYLSHSFVESPDMKNIYDGIAVLDDHGKATVVLPEWFEALNRDFRYQLTAIGGPGPNLHIAREVSHNQFAIGGGSAHLEVAWQVTGIRHDAYADQHRIPIEEDKAIEDRGKYLNPQSHGQSESLGIHYRDLQRLQEEDVQQRQDELLLLEERRDEVPQP